MAKCIIYTVLSAMMILVVSSSLPVFAAEGGEWGRYCLGKAVKLANDIKSRPDRHYLRTLDGQDVALADFYARCRAMHPWCCLYKKFYYWRNEIKTVISDTPTGAVAHKIRSYYNGISTYCPDMSDPQKTHGDVAEFYDARGVFMGLAGYMGDGKYCSLPDSNYHR